MSFYITGDTHGDFNDLILFCKKMLTQKDTMIIVGDSGINYYVRNKYSKFLYKEGSTLYKEPPYNYVIYKDTMNTIRYKIMLSELENTFFIIRGNHEADALNVEGYNEKIWNGGIVYYQEDYPNLLFAKDGEIYTFNDKKVFVCGGAYSVDKHYRLLNHYRWFHNEQPDDDIKERCEENLKAQNYTVDFILTHTCPFKYIPREMFLSGIDQNTVDNSTEQWLDNIEEKVQYKKWYCGHYHTDKNIDNIKFLFHKIELLD